MARGRGRGGALARCALAGAGLAAAAGVLARAAFAGEAVERQRTHAPPLAAAVATAGAGAGSGAPAASAAHRARREKAAAASAPQRPSRGNANAKVRLNNLVSKTVRRSLLAGDILYASSELPDGSFEASVRVAALEAGEALEFAGAGPDKPSAERRAAAAALAALPPAPAYEPRYPRPEAAAEWVARELESTGEPVEIDSTMADLLPTLASLPESLRARARYVLENEDPCRVSIIRGGEEEPQSGEVRTMQVSGRTLSGKLAAAMRARLLGESGEPPCGRLELRLAGRSAAKEAAIAVKILQRFLPPPSQERLRFRARAEHFEGYRKQGLVVSVTAS